MFQLPTLTKSQKQAKVDRLGALQAKFAALKPEATEAKQLEAEVESWFPDLAPEKSVMAEGKKFIAVVSAKGNKRSIVSMEQVYRKLGHKEFIEQCSFTLGALEELLAKEELPEFVESARTGNRSVTTAARAA